MSKRVVARVSAAKTIHFALLSYYNKYGHYPPRVLRDPTTGQSIHSWRVLITEFSDPGLYAQYDFSEPWNGPQNIALAHRRPSLFDRTGGTVPDSPHTDFIMWPSLSDLTDGTSLDLLDPDGAKVQLSDIMVVEIERSNIEWTKPDDVPLTTQLITASSIDFPPVIVSVEYGVWRNGSWLEKAVSQLISDRDKTVHQK